MENDIQQLPELVPGIRSLRETIITNIVLVGQVPAPTFHEKDRIQVFMERLAECRVDECSTDGYRNPIGIIRGTSDQKPPIFLVAHLDTTFDADVDHNYTVKKNTIRGAGILDNSVGAGVLLSMPEILRRLALRFESDIILAGVIQSIGRGNLRGIRHLLKTWSTPIRGAVCVEGVQLGRLNYYAYGMVRGEIDCRIPMTDNWSHPSKPNAILMLNEAINQILGLRLPQKPRARIVIGKIAGGFKHGKNAYDASLGFEIQSDSDPMVKSLFMDIKDIVDGLNHENDVDVRIKTISNTSAARLAFNHPLVKASARVMRVLDLVPVSEPSESELSIFLSRGVPAVTLGVTRGKNYHQSHSHMEINPMFSGIAQIIGVLMAIDRGVCDEVNLA